MKKLIMVILITVSQTFLFVSPLMSLSAPKRIGVGVAFNSSEIVVPIWISEKFVVEPEFRVWRHKSTVSNDFDLVEYRRLINFGLGFFQRFANADLSLYAGIRIDVSQDLTIEDYQGSNYREEQNKTLVNFGFSPVMGSEYFFHKRFSLGGEIQVNLSFTNIDSDSYDLKESSNSAGTSTKVYLRFYLK